MKRRNDDDIYSAQGVVAINEGRCAQPNCLNIFAPVNDDTKIQMPIIKANDDPVFRFLQNREYTDAIRFALHIVHAI